jgi:hypothetical protein
MLDAAPDSVPAQAQTLPLHPLRRGGDNDLPGKTTIGQRDGDRKAMGDLMNLVMVEKKADTHADASPLKNR